MSLKIVEKKEQKNKWIPNSILHQKTLQYRMNEDHPTQSNIKVNFLSVLHFFNIKKIIF